MAYASCRLLPEARFESYDCMDVVDAGSTLWGHLLVQISPDGRLEDHFRVKLSGSQRITGRFDGRKLLRAATLAHYNFTLERRPGDLEFKNNSCCTKWEDLESLVAAGRASASTADSEDADREFREAWATAKAADESLGAAIRWAVQAHPVYGFKLVLQGMPATARSLRRDTRLSEDKASCIELGSWTVATSMGKDGQWNGPVPVLFSTDVAAASASLRSHPERFSTGEYK
jgi:hypothetical protein